MAEDRLEDRFLQATHLADAGIEVMRQNLRRQHPDADPEEIARLLDLWLFDRPMDAPGTPRSFHP